MTTGFNPKSKKSKHRSAAAFGLKLRTVLSGIRLEIPWELLQTTKHISMIRSLLKWQGSLTQLCISSLQLGPRVPLLPYVTSNWKVEKL